MPYLKITNGTPAEYNLAQAQRDILAEGVSIRRLADIPEADRNALLAERGIYPYTQDERPTIDPVTQTVALGAFTQAQDGSWSRGWVVSNIPEVEREAAAQAEADAFDLSSKNIDQLKALVDVIVQVKGAIDTPTTSQVRQGLKNRILFYARKRRGL